MFLTMLITNIVCAGSSVIGSYLPYTSLAHTRFLPYFVHFLYFFFHSTLSICFALYIMNVTGTSVGWRRSTFVLFTVPYLISELLVLTNVLNHWAFYVDENSVYHRGPLMLLLYALGVFYVIMGFVFFFKNKKAISRVDSLAVGIFIIIATLGIATQAVWSSLLVELFFEALACLVLMIILEEKSGHVDPTTGLLNRVSFIDSNRRLLASKQKYSIVFIRIAELEKVVKRFGEREAESFLINVASFLLKKSDVEDVFCCRRESFAVVFKDENGKYADLFAYTVLDRFRREWNIDSLRISADAAITLIKVPEQINTLEELDDIISSDYQKTRPGSYIVPIDEVREITKSEIYETALKKAIGDKKLALFYQPIWSVRERKTVSAEALLRIQSDELKGVSPQEYIPIAEKTGLIRDIGLFVFEEVCRFLSDKKIRDSGIEYVELNLSVYQFMFSDLIESFEAIRKKYRVDAKRINLEITESAAALEDDVVSEKLRQFRDLGYTLSLDDFGTGYSNMMRMMKSDYINIKIDKSILWGITRDGSDSELLKSAAFFLKSQGFDIIQEGVETKEELELVTRCGCDYVQGYYFSRPVPTDEFVRYMEDEKN